MNGHQKAPRWAGGIAWAFIVVGLLVLLSGVLSQYLPSWEGLNLRGHTTNEATVKNAYWFPDDVDRIDLSLAPGETSRWIVTPPQSRYRIDSDNKPMRICYLDGSCYSLGPREVSYAGIKRGIFQIYAGDEATHITVTIERW
jgi:hypothetical protein